MKYLIGILLMALTGFESFSQTINKIGFASGIADNELFRKEAIDGGTTCEGKGSSYLGLTYQYSFVKSLSAQVSLVYSKNKINLTPNFYPGVDMTPRELTINMVSVPIYGKYSFWKFFFINAGPIIDLEMNAAKNKSIDNQSGIGFGMGIGGQYTVNNFTVSINPFSKRHVVVPFKKQLRHQRLQEIGIGFELGYNF